MPLSHKHFFSAGVVVLLAGLISAALIYIFSAETAPVEYLNRQSTEFQIERIGGMATVYVARFNLWLGNLWHGRQLAFTVAVLAIVIALVCFWISDRVSTEDKDENHKD